MSRPRRCQIVLRLTLALIALLGQSAVACVSASPDEAGAAAHVERSGIALHHAHNEATCVVCRVLSLHGRAPVAIAPAASIVAEHSAPQSVLPAGPEHQELPNNLSRAPPEIA